MAGPSLYELFMAQDEPSAAEKAQAMAQALSRQKAVGNLGLLTGDRVLGGFGQAQLQAAQQGESQLGQVGQHRSGQRFTLKRDVEGREFQSGEAGKQRGFTASENEKNRALQRELEGVKNERARAQAAAEATSGLRKEFNALPEVKEFKTVSVAFDKVRRAAGTANAAGDMALIFNFMKIQDPTSSVREGEYANAQNAGSWSDQMRNLYNKAIDGQFLTPQQRQHFVGQAAQAFEAHKVQVAPVAQMYRGLAQKSGANPDDVLMFEDGSPQAAGGGERKPVSGTDNGDGTVTIQYSDGTSETRKR